MILLTGHKGFVGSALHKAFTADGEDVVTLEKQETFQHYCIQLATLVEKHQFRAIVACGAISDNQYKNLDIFDWNTYSVAVLADICRRDSIHLIFISSQAARHPKTLYGHSKKMAEIVIRNSDPLSFRELAYCIFQPFNIYGEDESMKPPHRQSLPYRLKVGNLKVLWDTERDYIHVDDCVSAISKAFQTRATGTYHLGTGEVTPSVVLADRVDYNGYTCEDRPPYIEKYACADPERFLPGWQPTVDILQRFRAETTPATDPFDVVEISTKRAAANKERRFMTDVEMAGVECSAQHREANSC